MMLQVSCYKSIIKLLLTLTELLIGDKWSSLCLHWIQIIYCYLVVTRWTNYSRIYDITVNLKSLFLIIIYSSAIVIAPEVLHAFIQHLMEHKWTSDHKWKLSIWPHSGIQVTNTDPLCVYSWGAKPHSNTCQQSFNVDCFSVLTSAGLMRLSATTLINCWCSCAASDAWISMKRRGRLVCLSVDRVSVSLITSCVEEDARNVKPTRPILTKYRSIRWKPKTIPRAFVWLRYEANYSSWFPHWQMNQVWLCVYSCQHGLQFSHSILEKCTQQRL